MAQSSSSEPNVHVSVVIFKGDPIDWHEYRHTALWFRFVDAPPARVAPASPSVVMHVVGRLQEFKLRVEHERNPRESDDFAAEVDVGCLRNPMSRDVLTSLVSQTAVDNSDPEFNCQVWVQAALEKLLMCGQLLRDQYVRAVDGMVDATLEAEHEHLR